MARVVFVFTVSIFLAIAAAAQPPLKPHLGVHVTRVHDQVPPQGRTLTRVDEQLNLQRQIPKAPTSGAGLVIQPAFDSSITGNVNAVAIENAINAAISVLQGLYSNPITVQVYFRYATTQANGNPLGAGTLAESNFVYYTFPWATFTGLLQTYATTSNDTTANAHLPGSAITTSILPSSANGRALGQSTPGALDSSGGFTGSYDGIVTLNSSQPFAFTRPPGASEYDAQRATEHELDEVLGLGSSSNTGLTNYRPQDLFMYKSAGVWSVVLSDARYFSIDGGTTNIVSFNQDSNGDSGDWFSPACPQPSPYVQDAFGCQDQFSDVTSTSPEGINLDVVGYALVASVAPVSSVVATATTSTNVQVTWSGSCSTTCHVYRSGDGMTYTQVGSSATSPFNDSSASSDTSYLYKVRAYNGTTESADSNADIATTVIYTNAITAGSSVIQAVDINQMRDAVDAVRRLYGIGAGAYSYGSGTPQRIAAGTVVHAADINELRTNLNTAWNGLFGTTPTYTNTITAGVSTIQAIDFNEIRNVMK